MAIRSQIKLLGSDTIVYGVGHVLTKLIAFLLIPIYTRYLDLSDVGYYALLETMELLAVSFITSGMQYSLWRLLPKSRTDELQKFVISSINNFFKGILYIVMFGFGTILSMSIMTLLLSFPFTIGNKNISLTKILSAFAGILSITLGMLLGSDIIFNTEFIWY